MKLFELQNKLSKIKCFTPFDIKKVSGLSDTSIQKIIWRYIKKGIFIRLRNGVYMFKNAPLPHLWYIANKIYQPSYISFETALSYYGFIPESIYAVTSCTSKITRTFHILDRQLIYRKIKTSSFIGYNSLKLDDEFVLVAEPEKALIDYLYFVYLKKSILNDRLSIRKVNKTLLNKYVNIMQNKSFSKWIKNVI